MRRVSTEPVDLQVGNRVEAMDVFLSNFPPMVRFVDLTELDGNLLIKPQSTETLTVPDENFEVLPRGSEMKRNARATKEATSPRACKCASLVATEALLPNSAISPTWNGSVPATFLSCANPSRRTSVARQPWWSGCAVSLIPPELARNLPSAIECSGIKSSRPSELETGVEV